MGYYIGLIVFLILIGYSKLEKKIEQLEIRIGALEYKHKDDFEYEFDDFLLQEMRKKQPKKSEIKQNKKARKS